MSGLIEAQCLEQYLEHNKDSILLLLLLELGGNSCKNSSLWSIIGFHFYFFDMLLRIKKQMYKICGTMDEKTIKQKILIMEWTTIKLVIQIKKD